MSNSIKNERGFIQQGLNSEREKMLWIKCSEGDEEARETIILAYRPMVFWLARKFQVERGRYPDIVQEGMLALIKAVDGFDPSRGLKFTTYSFYRIKGQMINFLQRVEARAPVPVDDMDTSLSDPLTPEIIDSLLAVHEAIEKLPVREAEIVSDLLIKGRRAKDVATSRSMDVSHVYRLKRKAISRLKSWLGIENATSEAH